MASSRTWQTQGLSVWSTKGPSGESLTACPRHWLPSPAEPPCSIGCTRRSRAAAPPGPGLATRNPGGEVVHGVFSLLQFDEISRPERRDVSGVVSGVRVVGCVLAQDERVWEAGAVDGGCEGCGFGGFLTTRDTLRCRPHYSLQELVPVKDGRRGPRYRPIHRANSAPAAGTNS